VRKSSLFLLGQPWAVVAMLRRRSSARKLSEHFVGGARIMLRDLSSRQCRAHHKGADGVQARLRFCRLGRASADAVACRSSVRSTKAHQRRVASPDGKWLAR